MRKKHPNLPYELSQDGLIYKSRTPGIKKTTKSKYGYHFISYAGTTFLIHSLIWETFVGDIPKGLQINHIDGNKSNNRLSNLELVTPAENIHHAYKIGLKTGNSAETNSMAKLSNDQYLSMIHEIVNGATNDEIAEKYGLHSRYVSLVRHKKRLKVLWEKYEKDNGCIKVKNSPGLNSKIPIELRVEVIKRLPNFTNKKLAQELGIDPSTISNVRYKKSWLDAWEIVDSEGATTSESVGSSDSKRGAS